MIHCPGCKRDLLPELFAIDKARASGRRYRCRECSAAEYALWSKTDRYTVRLEKQKAQRRALKAADPKRRWAQYTKNAAVARAKALGLPCDITVDWIYANAPDVCPLLGIPLRYDNAASFKDSPAIDRMFNHLGYLRINCWVISHLANRIKSDATVDEIELMAKNLRHLLPPV